MRSATLVKYLDERIESLRRKINSVDLSSNVKVLAHLKLTGRLEEAKRIRKFIKEEGNGR